MMTQYLFLLGPFLVCRHNVDQLGIFGNWDINLMCQHHVHDLQLVNWPTELCQLNSLTDPNHGKSMGNDLSDTILPRLAQLHLGVDKATWTIFMIQHFDTSAAVYDIQICWMIVVFQFNKQPWCKQNIMKKRHSLQIWKWKRQQRSGVPFRMKGKEQYSFDESTHQKEKGK